MQSIYDLRTHLNTENTRAIFPIARILFRITSFLKFAAAPAIKPKIKYLKNV